MLLIIGCQKKHVPNKHIANTYRSETGLASYYADKFIGRPTASGQLYNANRLTAAHKTIAFGTKVTMVNIKNNKSVVVVINDRGPFVSNRILDVSKAAAQALDMINAGIVKVRLTYD
jgi:rare lipoprotein A